LICIHPEMTYGAACLLAHELGKNLITVPAKVKHKYISYLGDWNANFETTQTVDIRNPSNLLPAA